MSTPAIVPMFAPDGTVRQVPSDQVDAATKAGGELAHQMKAPDGSIRYVPHSQFGAALQAGGVPVEALRGQSQISSIDAGPKGVFNRASDYLNQIESDVRYGGTATIPGRILKAVGAQGLNRGIAENNPITNTLTGPITAAQGVTQLPSHPLSGVGNIVKGALNTAEIPLAFAGNAPGAAESVMGKTIPSVMKQQAGEKFAQVAQAANHLPVNPETPGSVALEIQAQAARGGAMPKVVRDFLRRVTDPEGGPLTYEEARDFYSNASRLSADEFNRLTPAMQRQVSRFAQSLGQSLNETAAQAGQGDTYTGAMQQYARGAKLGKTIQQVQELAKKAAVTGAVGAGGYATYKALTDK